MNTVKTLRQKRTSERNKAYQNTTEFKAVKFRKTGSPGDGSQDIVEFSLTNGSTIIFPVKAFLNLSKATTKQRRNYELTPYFVFWDDVDEIIGIKNLFDGSITL